VGRGIYFMENVKERMDIYFDKSAPSIVVEIREYRDGYLNIRNRGGKIRAFTEITPENIGYCKDLINLVDELRHLDGVRGGVAVSEAEYMATTVLQESTPLTQVIYSNVKEVIEQGRYIFETLWRTAVPAEKKIKEIEEGIIPEVIESINDPVILQNKLVDLLRTTKEELLIIFSTANAFHRLERNGSIRILKEITDSNPNVKMKILTPKDNEIEATCKDLANNLNIYFRFMDPISQVSILVVDRRYSIVAELRDDTKHTVAEAIGFATYSNSAPTVLTYAAIFDVIWKQIELYEQLQVHDRMQKEFINVAAHELRTPIQPIINVSDFVKSRIKDHELREFLDILNRNAKRLQKLAEEILDAAKIESHSLTLDPERFDLLLVIHNLIRDLSSQMGNDNNNVIIRFFYDGKKVEEKGLNENDGDALFIHADKNRITRVLSNILSNSIKFTTHGEIDVLVQKVKNHLSVKIKDSGPGIDKAILPKLFDKFITGSPSGTGLGLYICKYIIKAHGGNIWAENNPSNAGATFTFTLPLNKAE